MKQRQMMIVAIACGIVCAACVALFMVSVHGEADAARAEALARYGGEQVEAYIATRDIVAGERLDLSAVETKLWVADLLPERAIRSSSDAVGKTATSSIYKGEVITSGRFEVGKDSIDIPAGKQAVSVPAKAVQAVGGAIRPGMSVDVYSSGGADTSVIATGVNVLDSAVGSGASAGDGWITLAIDPEKVQEFIAASNKTTLYFTLPGASADDVAQAKAKVSEGDEASDDGKAPDDDESVDGVPGGSKVSEHGKASGDEKALAHGDAPDGGEASSDGKASDGAAAPDGNKASGSSKAS